MPNYDNPTPTPQKVFIEIKELLSKLYEICYENDLPYYVLVGTFEENGLPLYHGNHKLPRLHDFDFGSTLANYVNALISRCPTQKWSNGKYITTKEAISIGKQLTGIEDFNVSRKELDLGRQAIFLTRQANELE